MAATQTIEEFERARGVMLLGDVDRTKTVTEAEFNDLLVPGDFTGVNYEDREQWLRDNGYEINSETLIDASLSTKPSTEEGGI